MRITVCIVSFGDQEVEKEGERVRYMYPELGLGELDYFKVVVIGLLVEENDHVTSNTWMKI